MATYELLKGIWKSIKTRIKQQGLLFWSLVVVLFGVLISAAHIEGVGWERCRDCVLIPEAVGWDLNPVIWAPYGVLGSTRVAEYRTSDPWGPIPPQQHMILYLVTFLYWLFLALGLSKILTLVIGRFRNVRHRIAEPSNHMSDS